MDDRQVDSVQIEEPGIFKGLLSPPLLEENIGSLIERKAASAARDTAIISKHQNIQWTFEELQIHVRKLATILVDKGVKPGDKIFTLAGNCIEFVHTFFACTAIGIIAVIANITFTPKEVIKFVDFVGKISVYLVYDLKLERSSVDSLLLQFLNVSLEIPGIADILVQSQDAHSLPSLTDSGKMMI